MLRLKLIPINSAILIFTSVTAYTKSVAMLDAALPVLCTETRDPVLRCHDNGCRDNYYRENRYFLQVGYCVEGGNDNCECKVTLYTKTEEQSRYWQDPEQVAAERAERERRHEERVRRLREGGPIFEDGGL